MTIVITIAPVYYLHESSLDQVNIANLVFITERDHYTPKEWTSDVILNSVPDKSKVTFKDIRNTGHLSFISPFPAIMKSPNFSHKQT